jgi:hypothetical protein
MRAKAESKPLNHRNVFRWIALVAWVTYASGLLVFPFWDEVHERSRALDRDSKSYQTCRNVAAQRGIPDDELECKEVFDARMSRDAQTYRFGSEYQALGWPAVFAFLAIAFAPPLVLFGCSYLAMLAIVKTGDWIAKEYQQQT